MCRERVQQVHDGMSPCFHPVSFENGFDRLSSCLLRGEACPVVKAVLQVILGMLQVASRLVYPVTTAFHILKRLDGSLALRNRLR